MKKILTLVLAVAIASASFAQQTYYSWNFNTLTSTTFPAGFYTWNLDGITAVNSQSGLPASLNTNWAVFATSSQGAGFAACASWLSNTGVADNRWLVTSDMTVPTGVPNVCLSWSANSYNASAPESYNVLISTTDSSTGAFTRTLASIQGENGSATTHIVPLAQYAGQRIRIAFQDVSVNEYVLILNNIKMINLPSYAAHLTDVEVYEHNYIGNAVNITGIMGNLGFDTINDFTLNYSVNGAAPVTSSVTAAGLLPQQYYYYTHSVPFNPTTAGTYTIQAWFSAMNGTAAVSDTSSVTTFFYPQVTGTKKNVVIEEMTGAGCPWCPGGALALRDVHDNLSYVIPVAIHSPDINDLNVSPADAMNTPSGDSVVADYASGFPTGMVDRLYSFDNQTISPSFANDYYRGPSNVNSLIWDTLSVFRYNNATPLNVSLTNITVDSSATPWSLSVTVNGSFLNSLSQGDYRFNAYIVEDSLITTGNGYDQDNGAYSSAAGQTTNYNELYSLPAVLIDNGVMYSQNHVLRHMLGGAWGNSGDIPSAPVAGTTYSHTYTTTISSTWRPSYLNIIGLVQEYNTNPNLRTILNAAETKMLQTSAGIVETTQLNSLSVYPNPASTMATVEIGMKENAMVTVSVIDAIGQTVIAPSNNLLNAGGHSINIPVSGLATGLYMVKVSVNGEVHTMPLSVNGK